MAIEASVGAQVGNYILVKKLGEGGMAEVWLARHAASAQLRAIKFLNKQFQGIPEVEARFQTEGESQLVHPNIVRIYEVGQFTGSSYLAMDFIDGRDLEKILDSRRGPLTVPESVDIAIQILSGLGFAHASGIIHRDIKPSNVLVDSEGQAYLMDFGIAKALRASRSVTQVNSRLGTPDYMSPEQIRNPRDVDRRSDIYSFGCMFYELLTGWPPFDRGAGYETEHDIKTAHVMEPPTPPAERKAGLPAELNDITLHCLAKAKEDRPQSCEEILAALEAYRLKATRTQQPNRGSAPGLSETAAKPVTGPGTGYSTAPPASGADGAAQRRATEVIPGAGAAWQQVPNAGGNFPGQPQGHTGAGTVSAGGFGQPFASPVRTPTVVDEAVLGHAEMVAAEAKGFANLSQAPAYAQTSPSTSVQQNAAQAGRSAPARGNRTAIMAVGGVLLLGALGGGGWLLLHKEKEPAPVSQTNPTPTTGSDPGPGPAPTGEQPHSGPAPGAGSGSGPSAQQHATKKVLVVGDLRAMTGSEPAADAVQWKTIRISHTSNPSCTSLATDRPVAYVGSKADLAQIVAQHPELARSAAQMEIRPLDANVLARCGTYDAIVTLAAKTDGTTSVASGTLIWTGDPSSLGKHIIIVRSMGRALQGGEVQGTMFPAKPIQVTVRPAGAATVVAPSAKSSFNTLDMYLPNPGQQTIYLDWKELPNSQ